MPAHDAQQSTAPTDTKSRLHSCSSSRGRQSAESSGSSFIWGEEADIDDLMAEFDFIDDKKKKGSAKVEKATGSIVRGKKGGNAKKGKNK